MSYYSDSESTNTSSVEEEVIEGNSVSSESNYTDNTSDFDENGDSYSVNTDEEYELERIFRQESIYFYEKILSN